MCEDIKNTITIDITTSTVKCCIVNVLYETSNAQKYTKDEFAFFQI